MAVTGTSAAFVSLESYKLIGVIVTDHQLGVGSAAVVVELDYMGHKCAGKKIHDFLLKSGGSDYRSSSRSFSKECHFLSRIQHPNIVQFLGVYFQEPDETVPILVMEYLPTNLTGCIEHNGILPKDIGFSILLDISQGLLFLHDRKKPIIHRDLSSHNILVTPILSAKIADLGVARIINMSPLQVSAMTKKPGTEAYMPPEVMVKEPRYNTSIDIFSYGILMMQIFCGKLPMPHIGQNRSEAHGLVAVSEAERRKNYLEEVGNDHPLMSLIHRCIDNDPKKRPSAKELVEDLRQKANTNTPAFQDRLKMMKYVAEKEAKRNINLKREQENIQTKLKEEQKTNVQLTKQLSQKRLKAFIPPLCVSMAILVIFIAVFVSLNLDHTSPTRLVGVQTQDFMNSTMSICAARETIFCDELVPAMFHGLVGNLSWISGQDLQTTLHKGQTVIFEDFMCFGGGVGENEIHKYLVYCYHPGKNKWNMLPHLPVKSFGLGVFSGSLVAIGGITMDGEESTKLYTLIYDETSDGHWVHSVIPDMPIARTFPAVLSLPSALIVAGGENSIGIYTSDTGWYWSNQPLVSPCTDVTLAVAGNRCYLLAGNYSKELLQSDWFPLSQYIAIDDILYDRNKVTPGNALKNRNELIFPSYRWKELEGGFNAQANSLVGTVLASNLITVGMRGQSSNKDVRMYSFSQKTWSWISVLPEEIQVNTVTITSFSPTKLLMTGRKTDGYLSVYIGSL